jgi:DNA-binding transcriptional regulator YhcF (GntR family)
MGIFSTIKEDGNPVTFKGVGGMLSTKRTGGYVTIPDGFNNYPKQLMVLAILKTLGRYNTKTNVLTLPAREDIAELTGASLSTIKRAFKDLTDLGVLGKVSNGQYRVSSHYQDVMKIPSAFLNSKNLTWEEKLMIGQLYIFTIKTGQEIDYNTSKGNRVKPCGFTNTSLIELAKKLKSLGHVTDNDHINIYAVVIDEAEYEYSRAIQSEAKWKTIGIKERQLRIKAEEKLKILTALPDVTNI